MARRIPIYADAVILRPRSTVWQEMTGGERHPAWSEPTDSFRAVEGPGPGEVGHTQLYVGPPSPPFGLRSVIVGEIVEVAAELSRTTVAITPLWEYTERVDLRDTLDGHTSVAIAGWVITAPLSDELMHRTARHFTQIVQGYLRRAVDWRPGDPFKTNLLTPEPRP